MIFQQIRNATIIIKYANKKFVVDPWLIAKGSQDPVPSPNQTRIPTVELPMPAEQIMADTDVIIVTHIHPDHFHIEGVPKNILTLAQNQTDAYALSAMGFTNVKVLLDSGFSIDDITIYKTRGIHCDGDPTALGAVCGVVLQNTNEKTVYIAGDTIWCAAVQTAITTYQPDIIILNACGAYIPNVGRLIMDSNDLITVCQTAPTATVIASHMEAVNHATVSRADLQHTIAQKQLTNVLVPEDGERYLF